MGFTSVPCDQHSLTFVLDIVENVFNFTSLIPRITLENINWYDSISMEILVIIPLILWGYHMIQWPTVTVKWCTGIQILHVICIHYTAPNSNHISWKLLVHAIQILTENISTCWSLLSNISSTHILSSLQFVCFLIVIHVLPCTDYETLNLRVLNYSY